MDVGAQILQPLLVGDAEALFLIDDDEAELVEFHRLRQHRVGADDDLDTLLRHRPDQHALDSRIGPVPPLMF